MADEELVEEEPVEVEYIEPETLCIGDGECVIFDQEAFVEELGRPMLMTMTGPQLWLWYFENGEWLYTEIKGRPKDQPRGPAKAMRLVKPSS